MLMKTGGGGGSGRDVMFRLLVANDPANKQTLAQFGNELASIQKKATTTAVQEAKKRADNELKQVRSTAATEAREKKKEMDKEIAAALKRDKTIAGAYLKEHLKSIDDRAKAEAKATAEITKAQKRATDDRVKAEKKAEEELAAWKARVRANSAALEQREGIRLSREATAASAAAKARAEQTSARRSGGMTMAAGGFGSMARGIAYSGLVGEKNSERVVNTLLGVEAAKSVATGGMQFAKGASAATGMAMGAGGAMAGGGTAMAALVAWLPTLAAAVRAAAIAIKGSAATHKGDVGGAMWEGVASTSLIGMANTYKTRGALERESRIKKNNSWWNRDDSQQAFAGLELSRRDLEQSSDTAMIRRAAVAQQAGLMGQLGGMQREAAGGNLDASRTLAKNDVASFQSLSAGGRNNDAVAVAYENARQSMEQVKRLSVEAARTQIEGSRAYLDNLRGAAQEAQKAAEISRSAYESDISKASKLDPEGISKLREIDRKRKAGEGLSRSELEFAEGFNEFSGFTKSEQERRAEENGLSDIFSGGKEKARKEEQKAIKQQFEVWQSEVEVEMQHEVVVKLEGMNFADQLKEQFGEAIASQFASFEERTRKTIEEKIRGAQTQAANARSPTR